MSRDTGAARLIISGQGRKAERREGRNSRKQGRKAGRKGRKGSALLPTCPAFLPSSLEFLPCCLPALLPCTATLLTGRSPCRGLDDRGHVRAAQHVVERREILREHVAELSLRHFQPVLQILLHGDLLIGRLE